MRAQAAPCPSDVPDEIASVPVSLQTLKPLADRASPKIGVGLLAFSPDNYFLATRNGQCGNLSWPGLGWGLQPVGPAPCAYGVGTAP